MKCLMKVPRRLARVDWLNDENTLEDLQRKVDGFVEFIHLDADTIAIVNEEGKLQDRKHNVTAFVGDRPVDSICGNVVVVGTKHGELVGLTDEQIDKYRAQLNYGYLRYER